MVSTAPSSVLPTAARAPESVQPGGGLCVGLELAWGRLRRAWLRRFRPGYVRVMAGSRRGECPDCAHDVIDARDLKFTRNVCGHWFPPEADGFAWRGRLRLARHGLAEVVCFSALFGALCVLTVAAAVWVYALFGWLLVPLAVLWFESVYFFRDPERQIPADPMALLSPADGTVTHVGEVDEPDFAGGRALRVSIFLSVFNVHVNRAPRPARVTGVRYFPGCFFDARRPECTARNEQLWIDFEEETAGRPLRVKQISGAVARRIVCWLKPGDEVRAGERIGMIKFGSRTDVLVPAGEPVEIQVRVGDRVKGGSTVLGRIAAPAPAGRRPDGLPSGHGQH